MWKVRLKFLSTDDDNNNINDYAGGFTLDLRMSQQTKNEF